MNTLARDETFFSQRFLKCVTLQRKSGAECARKEESHEPAGWERVIYMRVCFTEAFIKLLITKRVLVGTSSCGVTPD